MKFTVNLKALQALANKASGFAKSLTAAGDDNVLIQAKKGRVAVLAANEDMYCDLKLDPKMVESVEEDGECAISVSYLNAVRARGVTSVIEWSSDEHTVSGKIRTGGQKPTTFDLKVLQETDTVRVMFPEKVSRKKGVPLPASIILGGASMVMFTPAESVPPPIRIDFEAESINFSASDPFRMVTVKLAIDPDVGVAKDTSMLMDRNSILTALSGLRDGGDIVHMRSEERSYAFWTDDAYLSFQKLADFSDEEAGGDNEYDPRTLTSHTTIEDEAEWSEIEIDCGEFAAAIYRVASVSLHSLNAEAILVAKIKKSRFKLSVDSEVGATSEDIDIEVRLKNVPTMTVNAQYLLELLNLANDGGTVKLRWNGILVAIENGMGVFSVSAFSDRSA